MRIVHVSLARGFRGGEQQALYLIEALAAQQIAQVLMVRSGEPLAQRVAAVAGVELREVAGRVAAARAIASLGKPEVETIGHAHDGHAHTALWASGWLGSRLPYVVSRRVLRAPKPPSWSGGKYALGRLRSLLCVSEAVAKAHRTQLGAFGLEIRVVYDAALRSEGELVPNLRGELGLTPDVKLVGTVAALATEKDVSTFVKTCATVAVELPNVHFVHIGSGTAAAQEAFEAEVAHAGLAGRLHALGFRTEATALMEAFDVFLFTSRWEGLGSSILEAQLRGVPVVSTAAGGTVELIEDRVSGMLAPIGAAEVLAKAVLEVLHDSVLRENLVAEAHARAEQFSVATMVTGTLAAYQSAVELEHRG